MRFFDKWRAHGDLYGDDEMALLPLTTSGPGSEHVGARMDGDEIVLTHLAEEAEEIYRGPDERAASEALEAFLRKYFREGCAVEFLADDDRVQAGDHGMIVGWDYDRALVELDDPPGGYASAQVSIHAHALNILDGWVPNIVRLDDGTGTEGEQEEARVRAALARTADQRARLKQDSPEVLGFEWQADAANFVLENPSEFGRAYLEAADATWTQRPGLYDSGPVRASFVVLAGGDGEEELEIASLTFPNLDAALQAWDRS